MPYIQHGGGSDISTIYLAKALKQLGYNVRLQAFNGLWRIFPWGLKLFGFPVGTKWVIGDSRNSFVFSHKQAKLITVERLFVLDPTLNYEKSLFQKIYHFILVKKFVAASYKASDVVISMSFSTAESIRRVFPWIQKLKIIHNAVDTTFFTPDKNQAPKYLPSPFRLLFVGNLSKRKGADLLPDIMRTLGDGFRLDYTVGLNPSISLPNLPNMHPIGELNQEAIRDAYRHADAVIFPTRLEGMPRVVMEAFACGTPVIGSRASSVPEIIDNGINGFLCNPDDTEEFVHACQTLNNNPELQLSMSIAARKKAEEKFSLSFMIESYSTLMREL